MTGFEPRPETVEKAAKAVQRVIVCEPDPTCHDQNVNRWYCARHDSDDGRCPLKKCGETS